MLPIIIHLPLTSSFILLRSSLLSLLSLSMDSLVWMFPSPVTSSQARWASFSLMELLRASCLYRESLSLVFSSLLLDLLEFKKLF